MIEFTGHGILLDIEGTTSSVSFVYDVMFPFVRRELKDYLAKQWGDPALTQAVETIAADAGHPSFDVWMKETGGEIDAQVLVRQEVSRLMDNDVKATGLKTLQGLVWKSGFASGELQAHVYDDVPAALAAWRKLLAVFRKSLAACQKLPKKAADDRLRLGLTRRNTALRRATAAEKSKNRSGDVEPLLGIVSSQTRGRRASKSGRRGRRARRRRTS